MPEDARKREPKGVPLKLNVVNLEIYEDPKTSGSDDDLELYRQSAGTALIPMTKQQIVGKQDEILILIVDQTIREYELKQTNVAVYADYFREIKKRKQIKYVLTDIYMDTAMPYNSERMRVLGELMTELPNIDWRPGYTVRTMQSIYELRNILCNKKLTMSAYDFLHSRIWKDDGDMFDFVDFCLSTARRPIPVGMVHHKKYKPYGPFLLRRGFPTRGRYLLPAEYQVVDNSVLDQKHSDDWEDFNISFDRTEWTTEKLKNKKVSDLAGLLESFPHKGSVTPGTGKEIKARGIVEMIDDVYVEEIGAASYFEYLTCGLYCDLQCELKELSSIKGKTAEQLVFTIFILALYHGYVDVRGGFALVKIRDHLNGWINWLLGKEKFQLSDQDPYDVTCCQNPNHVLRFHGIRNLMCNRRRVEYVNDDEGNDGECCYRYMMKQACPQVKIYE